MEYRRLGKSGVQVSVLSFGSWVSFSKQITDKTADELMGIAYDKGINFFDNAEVYALGESEKMMGRVLKKKKWDRTSFTVQKYFGDGEERKINPIKPDLAESILWRPVKKPCNACRWSTWICTFATVPIKALLLKKPFGQ